MFSLWLDYPSFAEEVRIVKETTAGVVPQLSKVMHSEQIIHAQSLVRRVPVPDNVIEYAVRLVTSMSAIIRPAAMPSWPCWFLG